MRARARSRATWRDGRSDAVDPLVAHVLAAHGDLPPIERLEVRDQPQQRALSRAARPHQRHHLAPLHRQVDALQDAAVAVRLVHARARDERSAAVLPAPRRPGSDQLHQVDARRIGGGIWRGDGDPGHHGRDGLGRRSEVEAKETAQGRSLGRSAPLGVRADPSLQHVLNSRDQRGHRQVHQARRREDREELEVLRDDLLAAEGELVHRDDRGQRGSLEHADRVVADGGQDRAHGLGKNDPPQREQCPHPERGCGQRLIAAHREDAAPDDFSAERGLIEGEAEDGRGHRGHDDADQGQRVEEEDELEEDGRAPEQPHVEPRRAREDRDTTTAA